MRLIEALEKINAVPVGSRPAESVFLACGFTPLHLKTFLTAALQERSLGNRIVCDTGVFGDLVGNLDRARSLEQRTVAAVVEWADLDARLSYRSLGGWLPTMHAEMLSTARLSLKRIEESLRSLSERALIAVCPPTLPLPPVAVTAEWQASGFELALRAAVAETFARIGESLRIRVVGTQRLDQVSPLPQRLDAASELNSGFPYTLEHAASLSTLLADVLRPPSPKKGLIIDLDDTVWRGLVGEIGSDAVSWTLDRHAQVHGLFQQLAASLAEAGVLLAIASKNDPSVAEAALKREDMVLKPEHVFPTLVHWRRKSESVTSILETWNIAADAVVFVDDSAIELAEVRAHHPDMECVLFPKDDPRAVVQLLRRLRDTFGKPMVLEEDRLRRDSIRRSSEVRDAIGSDGTEQFLSQLESVITLNFQPDPNDTRAFELLNKTNQFNLNGKRLTDSEWRALVEDPESFVLRISYRDKFGPLGNIAVVAGTASGASLVIRHWVMSCRAFARRIEHQALRAVFDRFGVDAIDLEFRQTERNEPTRTFLAAFAGPEGDTLPLTLPRERFDQHCPPTYHRIEHAGREINQHV